MRGVAGNVEAAGVGREVHWRVANERVRVSVADVQLPITEIASTGITGIHLCAAVCHASSARGGGCGCRRAAIPALPLPTHELDHGGELGAAVHFASGGGDGWRGAGGEGVGGRCAGGHGAAGASTLLLLLLLGGA